MSTVVVNVLYHFFCYGQTRAALQVATIFNPDWAFVNSAYIVTVSVVVEHFTPKNNKTRIYKNVRN